MATDPLQMLQAALSAPSNSSEQANVLSTLRESLEAFPGPIPVLVNTLISTVRNAEDSMLKTWVIELLHFALCGPKLSMEQQTQMASQTLDTLVFLVDDPNPAIAKMVIQCLSSMYPLLFRQFCANRSNPGAWDTLSACKAHIFEFVWAPNVNAGVRFAAIKFVQRAILVQSRGVPDPRLQDKRDPNLTLCPANHPFISAAKLETEGQKLWEALLSLLFTTQNADVLSAIVNSFVPTLRLRPGLIPIVLPALKAWTPAAFINQPAPVIKSAEKAVRIFLSHLLRLPGNNVYASQINEILSIQGIRMDKIAADEKRRKSEGKKRPATEQQGTEAKRQKLDGPAELDATSAAFLASFDFATLPAALVTDLIIANLEAFTEPALISLVQAYREARGIGAPAAAPVATTAQVAVKTPSTPDVTTLGPPVASTSKLPPTEPASAASSSAPAVALDATAVPKTEPVDPLQMDIDQDELEYEPDKLNAALPNDDDDDGMAAGAGAGEDDGAPALIGEFALPAPKDPDEAGRAAVVRGAVRRMWRSAEDGSVGVEGAELHMLLLVRLVTRVALPPVDGDEDAVALLDRQAQQRQILCDYVMADFPARIGLATTWMNEEWYNDRVRSSIDPDWRPNYDIWLNQIVSSYQASIDSKDKSFSKFLLDLPSIPPDVLEMLRELCVNTSSPELMQVGFTALRGLVTQRPSLRNDALHVLLELTTHAEKRPRGAAINSVKAWVPNVQPMDGMIRDFALQVLRKLQLGPTKTAEDKPPVPQEACTSTPPEGEVQTQLPLAVPNTERADDDKCNHSEAAEALKNGDEFMEDGQLPPEDLIQTPYLPDRIELPAQKQLVLQHVELLFALSVKVPEFLDEIFAAYGEMDATVQEAIQELITALIRSLGPNHTKLLTLLRTFPPGSESLALRVLTIFTEHGRPSAQLVSLVKSIVQDRNLDARFLIPIIGEMDKADIMRHLPKIISLLDGKPEAKNLVRSVFSSIVTTPPQTFGSVTSNMPRVRQSELLTPQELMVLLHDSEKEIGLKSAIEAIGICFSMTDVFRSEILAVVMQQIMDEPVLPVLFLRTVIQAVTTYKSLVGFVSTTLLSRLITKKIWTNPHLWVGFMRCAKVIAPASFGALLQLPKEQLRELVDKQPELKAGLRDYVTKKASNKARVAGFLDIVGDGEADAIKVETLIPASTTTPA